MKKDDVDFITELTRDLGNISADALQEFRDYWEQCQKFQQECQKGNIVYTTRIGELQKEFCILCEKYLIPIIGELDDEFEKNISTYANALTESFWMFALRHHVAFRVPFFWGLVLGKKLYKENLLGQ